MNRKGVGFAIRRGIEYTIGKIIFDNQNTISKKSISAYTATSRFPMLENGGNHT